jgi:SET domain-containing protein
MFLIKYSIKHSPNKGYGIFTNQFIKKGQLIWDFNKSNTIVFDTKREYMEYLRNSNKSKKNIVDKTLIINNKILYIYDDMQFMNHNLSPNSYIYNYSSYALKDINIGEEIFEDYTTYDDHKHEWFIKLLEQYNLWTDYIKK